MKIGIVADDLTGAMDAAVPFADLGLGTSVALDVAAAGPLAAGDTPVVSVDACTRVLPPARASAIVRDAMERLLAREQRFPFKKMDSTLRGNVGAETLAALAGSGRRSAIISPAAPRLGRCLRGGRLLLDGSPVADGDLVQALRDQLPDMPVRRLAAGEEVPPAEGSRQLYVADAEEERHLDQLVDAALARSGEILLVGSAGLAGALARRVGVAGSPAPVEMPRRYRRILFVVGSRNSRSAAQVQELLATGGVADLGLLLDQGATRPLVAGNDAMARVGVIHVKGLDNAAAVDSVWVAQRLAAFAAPLVSDHPLDDMAIVMTGGDTARAVLERLGVRVLEVSRSLAPGVVLARPDACAHSLSMVTKAGGFGDTDLFVRIVQQLLEGR